MGTREMQVLPEGATVVANWANYYQLAWAARERLMEEIIASGETSLPRILNLFQAADDRLKLTVIADHAGNFTGKVVLTDEGTSPIVTLAQPHSGVLAGEAVRLPPYVGFNLSQLLADFAGDADTVAELGSGYGLQLFRLFHQGAPRGATYVAREVSESGRRLTKRLAEFQPDMRLEVGDFDFAAPDLSFLQPCRKVLLFVHFAIYMTRSLPWSFFEQIGALSADVTLVAVEPLGFQAAPHSAFSPDQANMLNGAVNTDFFAGFQRAVDDGILEKVHVGPHYFGRDLHATNLASVFIATK
ncbi:MAG TPA: hypothetical protein VK196_16725 [Magnetospirillum sp.]|nr:hypothetical protein [Magnetospirillum sp.]